MKERECKTCNCEFYGYCDSGYGTHYCKHPGIHRTLRKVDMLYKPFNCISIPRWCPKKVASKPKKTAVVSKKRLSLYDVRKELSNDEMINIFITELVNVMTYEYFEEYTCKEKAFDEVSDRVRLAARWLWANANVVRDITRKRKWYE